MTRVTPDFVKSQLKLATEKLLSLSLLVPSINKTRFVMNKELEKTIRYLKHLGLENRPNAELACLSDLDLKTITRSNNEIIAYFQSPPRPSSQECLELDERAVEYFVTVGLGNASSGFKELFGSLCGYLLVYRFGLLSDVKTSTKAIKAGRSFLDLALQILAYKDASQGVRIHSENKSLRYLKAVKNKSTCVFDQLFEADGSYKAGAYSKSYKLTSIADSIIGELGTLLRKNLKQYVALVNKHMKGIEQLVKVTPFINPLICLPTNRTFTNPPKYIHLDVDNILKLSLVSMIQVLNLAQVNSVGKPFSVPLKNLANTDENVGRDYNIFTRLRSHERTALGYINYDLSSGIQIISFGILYKYAADPDLFEKYPLLFKYGWNPAYKKGMRETVAKDQSIGVGDVKKLLTSYANGSKKQAGDSPLLEEFREESDMLRREVISVVKQYEPNVYNAALDQSKWEISDELGSGIYSDDSDVSRKEASVFFFIWTYYEKQIRDAMLSELPDGIPVHDAVYSKQQVPFAKLEKAVFDQTGFEVKIGH